MRNVADTIAMERAAAELGISNASLRQRVAAGELSVYVDPLDRRRRLLRRRDLEEYVKLRPLRPRPTAPGAA